MTPQASRRRVVLSGVAVVLTAAFSVVTRMEPELFLVLGLVCLISYVGWFRLDLGRVTFGAEHLVAARARIHAHHESSRRAHRRVSMLRSQLAYGRPDSGSLDRLHELLVSVVDDELASTHSIDRSADPEAARAVLGDELARFLDDPGAARQLADRRSVDRIVSLIESI